MKLTDCKNMGKRVFVQLFSHNALTSAFNAASMLQVCCKYAASMLQVCCKYAASKLQHFLPAATPTCSILAAHLQQNIQLLTE